MTCGAQAARAARTLTRLVRACACAWERARRTRAQIVTCLYCGLLIFTYDWTFPEMFLSTVDFLACIGPIAGLPAFLFPVLSDLWFILSFIIFDLWVSRYTSKTLLLCHGLPRRGCASVSQSVKILLMYSSCNRSHFSGADSMFTS